MKDYLRARVTDFGMDGWMSDFGQWSQADGVSSDGSDPIVRHNRYSVDWHRLWREVTDEVRPDGDFVVFARSRWTGVQQGAMIYWVGDSLLVAPVLEERAVQRSVYLPPGSTWYDVWTGDACAGGQTVVRSAPVGFPPVFSRDMDRGDLRAIP